MNPIFTLKNFRSFGEEGADFELAPITVLTGRNSAGKSSLVKALILLSLQSEKKYAELYEPGFVTVDDPIGAELPIYSNKLGLGNFSDIINKESQDNGVALGYVVHSEVLDEDVRVAKIFRPQLTNVLTYGRLSGVRIERLDGTEIYGFLEGDANRKKDGLEKMFNTPWIDNNIVEGKDKERFLTETLQPSFLQGLADKYIDSSSALIKRMYSIDDDDKIAIALRKLFDRVRSFIEHARKEGVHPKDIDPTAFIDQWIKKFDIGDRVEIATDDIGGLGQYLYLCKGDRRCLLADEGYGITQLFALLLQIANTLPYHDSGDRNKPKYICVEEPEVHLHPAYQSLLAELFVEAYLKYNIHFIIETHSEYLIRRLQVLVADKRNHITPDDVSINYVEKDENNVSHNRQIKIKNDGGLSEAFGHGFVDEADKWTVELMKL